MKKHWVLEEEKLLRSVRGQVLESLLPSRKLPHIFSLKERQLAMLLLKKALDKQP